MIMNLPISIVSMGLLSAALHAQEARFEDCFDEYFVDRTMRVDYLQTGDAEEMLFSIDQVYQAGAWAGNSRRLLDRSGYGMYFVKVYDAATDRLLYSRGFATIFGEYRTTTDAKNGLRKSFHQSALVPFPKSRVTFVIEARDDEARDDEARDDEARDDEARDEHGILVPVFTARIDPGDINVIRESPHRATKTKDIAVHGLPHEQVDIALVAEGYTAAEEAEFWQDAERFTDVIFRHEPFRRQRAKISVRAVFFPSSESGADEPRQGIFRNTAVDSAFNALDLGRYLLVDDNKALRDIATAVPYDIVGVLVNSPRYGGGGIYNDYCISTVDHDRSEEVFMHEFGHAFGCLADEYFTSEVSYNEFYPAGREPYEPNITALLDPKDVKWKHLLTPGIPIPTPWGQDEIESLQAASRSLATQMREEIEKLEAEGGTDAQIRAVRDGHRARLRDLEATAERVRRHFQDLYRGKVGVFEGAGYSPKGLYRSEVHVGMLHQGSYGPVSEEAITEMIQHLSGGTRRP